MAENRNDVPDREAAKLCFEFFKHFTTVSTTVALVELALVQFFELDSFIAGIGLVTSGITLLLSIFGMLSVAMPTALTDEIPKTGFGTYILMLITALMFLAGILTFAWGVVAPFPNVCLFPPPFFC